MLKNKKRVLFLLAANSILSAGAYSESISDAKYEKLYNNIPNKNRNCTFYFMFHHRFFSTNNFFGKRNREGVQ